MTLRRNSGTIRALMCDAWGAPDKLSIRRIARPIVGDNDVLINVQVATANFADLLMIAGTYQTRPNLPFAPGLDAAGIVETAPREASLRPGERVVAILWHGGFAEQACAALAETFVIPGHMPFDVAAALASSYTSAGLALIDIARLEADETVLVLGAGGGAGMAAVQIAKAVGARVVAVASTAEKQGLARQAGADLVLSSANTDWIERVCAFTAGRGAEVCFDPVGGAQAGASLSAVGWGGRYIVFGFAAGAATPVSAARLLVKNRAMLGVSLRHFRVHRPDRLQAIVARLFAWWDEGLIAPGITRRYPLERAGDALGDLAAGRAMGKIVIDVGHSSARTDRAHSVCRPD